ncbi:MAG: O-methyltransferase [Anaerovoracaceae bacterium]
MEGFYKPPSKFLDRLRRQAEDEGIPVLLKETENFLETLLSIVRPNRILEIGTAIGYSALYFKELLPESVVTTVEVREDMARLARDNFLAAGAEIELIRGDAVQVLKGMAMEKEVKPYDFVFIDGGHGRYLQIWNALMPFWGKGTVIVSDNVLFKGMTASDEFLDKRRNRTIMNRMREYLEHISKQEGVTTSVLPLGDGIGISVIL